MFFGSIIMMFYTNWIMAASGIAATLIGFALMMAIISHSQKYFSRQQTEWGRINGYIEEIYTGHLVVKVYNGEKEAKETFRAMNRNLYDSAWKSQFMSGLMQPLMGFVGNFGYVVVCVVGALLTMNGIIKFGTIVAFMIYIRLFTQPLSQIAQAATSLQSTAAASERVFTLEDNYGVNIEEQDGEICLKVDFCKSKDAAELHRMLWAWREQAAKLEAGEITQEEYDR